MAEPALRLVGIEKHYGATVAVAGIDLDGVGIEVSGRALAVVGERPVQETEGRVYQQVEIPSGPFRRVVELHGGSIAVHPNPGGGAMFRAEIPAS